LNTLLKKWLSRLLGKSGPPVVAVFLSGEEAVARAMARRMRELAPEYPHIIIGPAPLDRHAFAYAEQVIELGPGRLMSQWSAVRHRLGRRWIGMAPFLWQGGAGLRWIPWLVAPHKLLAFNADLERHHLRLICPIASWRFLRGERVGDIFRPTAFAGLKKLAALIGFPLLLVCWAAVQVRRRAGQALVPLYPAGPGITTVIPTGSWAGLDAAVVEARADRILLLQEGVENLPAVTAKLEAALNQPGVWLAYLGEKTALRGGIPAAGEAKEHEQGTWALCGPAAAVLFRRDVYLGLGGAAQLDQAHGGAALLAMSWLGWLRGHRTVFAGPAGGQTLVVAPERLLLGATPDFSTAMKIHLGWAWQWRRWKGALAAVGAPAVAAPPGKANRNFLPLLEEGTHVFRGRPPGRARRVAVLTPYLPFPLSHGGAVRIFNLLREASAEADIYLFAFAERETGREIEPLLQFCAQAVLVRTPRWESSTLLGRLPPGVEKFRSAPMRAALATVVADEKIPIVQVEFTQLAHFGPWLRRLPVRTVLVEHDVTFDLHRQLGGRQQARWRRYEVGNAQSFDRVIAMSEQDGKRLAEAGISGGRLRVVENGVDLDRFRPPAQESTGPVRLLFIGSFRHFPNVLGFRFLVEEVWPMLRASCPQLRLTVVAGPDPEYYWRLHTGSKLGAPPEGVDVLGFVEDVRPLYHQATVVVAPLVVSAGTNLKVLEAMACGRAMVSTTVGAAGLSVEPGETILLADTAGDFSAAVLRLLGDRDARQKLGACARAQVEALYGWPSLAKKLAGVWEELAP